MSTERELEPGTVFTRVRPVYLPHPRTDRLATYLVLAADGDAKLVRLGLFATGASDREVEAQVESFVGRLRELSPEGQRAFFASCDETTDVYVRLEAIASSSAAASGPPTVLPPPPTPEQVADAARDADGSCTRNATEDEAAPEAPREISSSRDPAPETRPVVTVTTDLGGFTGAGYGTVRIPTGTHLKPGQVIAVTDDDADTVNADVLAVRGDKAEVRAHWNAPTGASGRRPDADRGRAPVCDRCGAGRHLPATKPKVVERDGRVAVITGVPVLECDACGEAYLEPHAMRRLDELFDDALGSNQVAVRRYTGLLPPPVTAVRVVRDFVLEVAFADGTVGEYDFAGKLPGPVFAPLREDYDLFCAVRVSPEMGTIVWPVGEDPDSWPDWAPEELYDHIRGQGSADQSAGGSSGEAGFLCADPRNEDDDGNGWALVPAVEFHPELVYPGTQVLAGLTTESAVEAVVLRTELAQATPWETTVRVTLRWRSPTEPPPSAHQDAHQDADETLPKLAADLTWVKANGGRAWASIVNWDEDRAPVVGERVLACGGGPPIEAVITELRDNGTIVLTVPPYMPTLPADLNAEDDDGHGYALVPVARFRPDRVFPGAQVVAGRPGSAGLVTVRGTELFETTGGETKVMVTFDQHPTQNTTGDAGRREGR